MTGQQSHPIRRGEEATAPPGSFATYLVVMIALTFFTFVLIHANAGQELSVDARDFYHDLRWGALIALLYWSESLASRSIVIDPHARRETNFGYNTREVTVLALALLTGAVVVMVRQARELDASGWAILAPLLVFRALYDFSFTMQLRKAA